MVSTWNLLTPYCQACDLSPSTLQSLVLWVLLLLVTLLLLLSALLAFCRQQIKVMTENFKPSNSENVLNCSHCIKFIPQRRYSPKTAMVNNKKFKKQGKMCLLTGVRSQPCLCSWWVWDQIWAHVYWPWGSWDGEMGPEWNRTPQRKEACRPSWLTKLAAVGRRISKACDDKSECWCKEIQTATES